MMNRSAISLIPLLLLVACGSPEQRTSRLLDQRLQRQLNADVSAGRATITRLPDGDRVTLLNPDLFPNGVSALDDKYPDIRANVVEAMLDPSLMRVQVADTTTLPDPQRAARVRNVTDYFAANGLASVLTPADPDVSSTGNPTGVVVTLKVVCPENTHSWTYNKLQIRPDCE